MNLQNLGKADWGTGGLGAALCPTNVTWLLVLLGVGRLGVDGDVGDDQVVGALLGQGHHEAVLDLKWMGQFEFAAIQ